MRLIAVEYPRAHDVGDALMDNANRLPEGLRSQVDGMAKLMAELAAVRGPAFCGYEREGIPASRAFKKSYAEKIYLRVEGYVEAITSSIKEHIPWRGRKTSRAVFYYIKVF